MDSVRNVVPAGEFEDTSVRETVVVRFDLCEVCESTDFGEDCVDQGLVPV
jgi:hypothetical protein